MARTKGNLTADEIVELYKTKSVNAIAAIDGTCYVTVLKILHCRGVKMRKRGNNEVRVPQITHGYCQEAKKFGMTPYRYVRLAAIVKLGGRCVRCGDDDLYVLDINHINGEQATSRSRGSFTAARYKQHCRILDGQSLPFLEVTCGNCNRRHEVERGNIPKIPQEFLCLHESRLKSSASVVRSSTVKKFRAG